MSRHTAIKRPLFPHPTFRLQLTGIALAALVLSSTGLSAQAASGDRAAAWPTPVADSSPGHGKPGQDKPGHDRPGQGQTNHSSGRTYYVAPGGNDANSGQGRSAAVRSLAAVSALSLRPGDEVRLRRGASYDGTLVISASGRSGARITVSSYGQSKRAPSVTGGCVRIDGDYVTLSDITAADCAEAGVRVVGDHNLVRRIRATGSWAGVEIMESAYKTRVVRNEVVNNTRMWPGTTGDNDDNGAFGILVHGDDTEIAYNKISGQVAASADYGTDGSAVEIYGGRNTYVHHNKARDNKAFTELGNPRSANTVYEYNVSVSSVPFSEFLVTRGANDFFGPIPGTVASNNTVRNTGNGSQGFYCYGGCSPSVMTLNNNIFDISGRIGYADGPFGGGGNIYWGGGSLETPLLPGDQHADPKFVSQTDLHVASTSPAIDQSATSSSKDLTGRAVPTDGNGDGRAVADSGAYESATP